MATRYIAWMSLFLVFYDSWSFGERKKGICISKSPSHRSQHCLAYAREGVLYPPTSVGTSYLEYVHVLMYKLMKMSVLLYNVC